jgi:hypothetical protein
VCGKIRSTRLRASLQVVRLQVKRRLAGENILP